MTSRSNLVIALLLRNAAPRLRQAPRQLLIQTVKNDFLFFAAWQLFLLWFGCEFAGFAQ